MSRMNFPNLLLIQTSPRGAASKARMLAADFVSEWRATHAQSEIRIRDLDATEIPYVDQAWIDAVFTPAAQRSEAMNATLRLSDELIAELKWADRIVISTPMYNFTVPARLKAWIDQVVRIGETFTPSYEGLVTGKKVTVIVVSGGDFTPSSPYAERNDLSATLRHALDLMGMRDVDFILAGKTMPIDLGQASVDDYRRQHRTALQAAI